jgi:hypothetical protein
MRYDYMYLRDFCVAMYLILGKGRLISRAALTEAIMHSRQVNWFQSMQLAIG